MRIWLMTSKNRSSAVRMARTMSGTSQPSSASPRPGDELALRRRVAERREGRLGQGEVAAHFVEDD